MIDLSPSVDAFGILIDIRHRMIQTSSPDFARGLGLVDGAYTHPRRLRRKWP